MSKAIHSAVSVTTLVGAFVAATVVAFTPAVLLAIY
jgi:hypothetical protein